MKHLPKFALLLAGLAILVSSAGANSRPPGLHWWTDLYVQNAGDAGTYVSSVAIASVAQATAQPNSYLVYGPTNGTPLPPGGSIRFQPGDYHGWTGVGSNMTFGAPPDDFDGSVLFNATQPVEAVVELTNRGPYYEGLAVSRYEPTDVTAPPIYPDLYFPVVKYNTSSGAKTSTLLLQNLGDTYGDIDLIFKCGDDTYYDTTPYLQPGTMMAVDPSSAQVPAGSVCTAVASSSFQMAGVYTEHYVVGSENVETVIQSAAALTWNDASATLYSPIFKNRYPFSWIPGIHSRTTGFVVMNIGDEAADITGTFYGVAGYCTTSQDWSKTYKDIAPLAAAYFLYPANVPDGCLGTAKFTSGDGDENPPLVGMVSEAFLDPIPDPDTQSATIAPLLPVYSGTTRVLLPVHKEKYDDRVSGIAVMNISDTTATVEVIFRDMNNPSNVYTTQSQTILPNRSWILLLVSDQSSSFWDGTPMPSSGGLFAVEINSIDQGAQLVIAEASEATYYEGSAGFCYGQSEEYPCFDRANYIGFNVP